MLIFKYKHVQYNTSLSNIIYKSQREIGHKMLPAVEYGDDAFVAAAGDAEESGHGHVEVVAREIAPTSIVVRRTEVCSRHRHGCSS